MIGYTTKGDTTRRNRPWSEAKTFREGLVGLPQGRLKSARLMAVPDLHHVHAGLLAHRGQRRA